MNAPHILPFRREVAFGHFVIAGTLFRVEYHNSQPIVDDDQIATQADDGSWFTLTRCQTQESLAGLKL
jgi:hypothetical protein